MFQYFLTIALLCITLTMPVACFAHPCVIGADAPQAFAETVAGQSDPPPMQHDLDDCDSTLCCAEYVPESTHTDLRYLPLVL